MNTRLILLGTCAAFSVGVHAATQLRPRAPQSLKIEGPAPLGVYQGAGCDGVNRLREFEHWFGSKPDLVVDFLSWQPLRQASVWAPKCWADAGQKTVVYSLPMLPDDHSATLADGAAGHLDEIFRNYAAVLVRYGYADSVIRIGWEFNGNWYPWQAQKDPQSWIAYWRRIVTAMRQVPGAHFRFDWNAAAGGGFNAEQVYPGDEYVDIIGLDFYNESWDPKITSPEARWEKQFNEPNGPQWQRDFARAHNKPISFPEWGTGKRPKGFGGGDDAYFIRKMAQWIAANDVAYHDYWDYAAPDYNARLSDGHQPAAAAAFLEAFAANRKSSATGEFPEPAGTQPVAGQ